MYGQELEADEQPNIQKELNASISMISVQTVGSGPKRKCSKLPHLYTNFAPAAINAALRQRYKSKVNQLLLAFTVDRWDFHTNTVLDFEQMFFEQQEQSNFHSKLPCFTEFEHVIAIYAKHKRCIIM